jgi:chemotaxis protein CheD
MKKLLENYPGFEGLYLMSGEGGVFAKPSLVQTVLGSCVAVTFHCKRLQVGATFHALMPRKELYAKPEDFNDQYRYVDSGIQHICETLFRQGVRQQEIECKIFGGASAMFQHEISVGPKNVQTAFEILATYPIRVVATHVGGEQGRKIVFISSTGEVYVRHIKRSQF